MPNFNDKGIAMFLDWIVAMDFQHYVTTDDSKDVSHWYLKRSLQRFTSEELLTIYNGEMSDELRGRWNWSLADSKRP